MAKPISFWEQALALLGGNDANAAEIAQMNALPTAPVSGDQQPPVYGPEREPAAKKAAPAPYVKATPYVPMVPANTLTALLPYQEKVEEEQQKQTDMRTRASYFTPAELASRLAEGAKIPQYSEQEKLNNNYKDMVAMEARKPQELDLSGLMGMADVLSNNKFNLRGGYKPPVDKSKEILTHMNNVGDNQRDFTKSLTGLLNAAKSGTDISTAYNMLMNKALVGDKTGMLPQARNGSPTNQALAFARLTGSESKDLRSRGELIDTVLREVNSGNPTALNNIPTLAARIIEGTVRPQLAVINKEGGDSSWWQAIENKLTRIATGQTPEEQRAQYADLFGGLLEQHKKDVAGTTKRWKTIASKIPGFTDKDFNDTVGPDWLDPHASSSEGAVRQAPKSPKIQKAKQENSLPVGTVEGGYKYLGGDAGNPKSWQKVE